MFCTERELRDEGQPWEEPGAELLREDRPFESTRVAPAHFFAEAVGDGGRVGTDADWITVIVHDPIRPVRKRADRGEALVESACVYYKRHKTDDQQPAQESVHGYKR